MANGWILAGALFLVNLGFFVLWVLFTYESMREQEPRAPRFGWAGMGVHALVGILILAWPSSRVPLAWLFGLLLAGGVFFLLPIPGKARSLRGAAGYLARDGAAFEKMDERESMFARNRSLRPGSPEYDRYYEAHPEHREYDERRRARGGPLGRPGAIDGGYRPNVAMLASSFELPNMVGDKARVDPASAAGQSSYAGGDAPGPEPLDPEKASRIVKGWAGRLGADLVGICRVDPRWAYSRRGEIHYGEWESWGREVPDPLPYAVVIATEMDSGMVAAAPHTPSVVESACNYSRGAYITTILAQWFGTMGYRAVAEHNRHYDLLMVPLAVDAGLGELGRLGYLIADRFGPRVRLFAVQTDMPLAVDRPVDLGAERFCEACKKCAEACPSKSLPLEREQGEDRGIVRWKMNAETCFDYWGRIGTDCCVCMAVCPFSRPYRSIHRLVRFLLRRSLPAQRLFPYIDNLLYGRRWRSRPAPNWAAFPKERRGGRAPSAQNRA
ncbi:MAG: reductive dehalogenase [Deltaproteobacteria bacterium]|nr:reductive dehalogenase [Deltaproteobacteria bacterium]